MKSYSKKYQLSNNYDGEQVYQPSQENLQNCNIEDVNLMSSTTSDNNPDLIETEDLNNYPTINHNLNINDSYKIHKLQNDNVILDQEAPVHFSKDKKINQYLQETYEMDKFINGAIIAIKSQNYAMKYIVDHIRELTDRNVSEGYVRKVWDFWSKYKECYFQSSHKTRMYTKHEAVQLYDAIFKQHNPSNSLLNCIPKIKEVLQKHALTKKILVSYSQFEEVKGLDTEETYMQIKEAIENGEQSPEPKWVDVSVRMMISASQFEYKKQIEIQCFNKLKSYMQFSTIQLLGVVMGETLNGRGKFIYIHCKYDQSVIKRNKYLKRFFLELIPDWFYSYNCVHSQKIAIFKFSKFISIQSKFIEDQNRKRFTPSFPNNTSLNQSQRMNNTQQLNMSFASNPPFPNHTNIIIQNQI